MSQKSDIPYTAITNWCKEEIMPPNYGRSHGLKVEYNEMEHIKKYHFISEHSSEGAKTIDAVLNWEYCMAVQLKEQSKRIEIPNIKKVDYAIGVNGNGMEPVYHDWDTLLVEMTDEIDPGDIGIFLVDNESYVKNLEMGI